MSHTDYSNLDTLADLEVMAAIDLQTEADRAMCIRDRADSLESDERWCDLMGIDWPLRTRRAVARRMRVLSKAY